MSVHLCQCIRHLLPTPFGQNGSFLNAASQGAVLGLQYLGLFGFGLLRPRSTISPIRVVPGANGRRHGFGQAASQLARGAPAIANSASCARGGRWERSVISPTTGSAPTAL